MRFFTASSPPHTNDDPVALHRASPTGHGCAGVPAAVWEANAIGLWTPSQFPTIPSLSPHRRAMVALSPACQGSAGKVDFQVGQAGPPRFGSRLRRSDRDDSFVSERPKPKGTRNRSAARSSPRLHSPHRGSPPARPRRASCSGTLAGAGPRGADGEWCTRSAKLDAKQRARRCVTPVLIAP